VTALATRVRARALRWLEGRLLGPWQPWLARLVRRMAETGAGTDACLAEGCLPLRVHFYSPVPDVADLERRGVFERRSALPGVELDLPGQLARLARLGERHGAECAWPSAPTGDPRTFYTQNGAFSFGCAAALHAMVRDLRPRRVVEVGSGNSSLVLAAALRRNADEDGRAADYTIVDPHPGEAVKAGLPGVSRLVPERVELLEPDFFGGLGEGDVLFVDSGHVVKTGGDVNFLVLDVLPRLAPGVVVHFHDVPMPYEYPAVYFRNPAFRVFWTESYLLQAFLAFNREFEVLLALEALMRDHADAFRRAFPAWQPEVHQFVSSSFWLRRRPATARAADGGGGGAGVASSASGGRTA